MSIKTKTVELIDTLKVKQKLKYFPEPLVGTIINFKMMESLNEDYLHDTVKFQLEMTDVELALKNSNTVNRHTYSLLINKIILLLYSGFIEKSNKKEYIKFSKSTSRL